MTELPHFPAVTVHTSTQALREEIRSFLQQAIRAGRFTPRCDGWLTTNDPEFSRELGSRGYLGITWPQTYGGRGLSNVDRYVVVEELLAAGAPVGAHWLAERQVGPSILKNGTPEQKERYLPAIARGELFVAIGLSEPDSGSDLASIRTRARRVADGWQLRGRKVWTSHANRSHALLALCRTGESGGRHEGLTQFLVELPHPNVEIRSIRLMTGEKHFCEVTFDDAHVPDDAVLGQVGAGWAQVMSELAYERSGPERFLSTYPLFRKLLEANARDQVTEDVGRLLADLTTLRHLSIGIARLTDEGRAPGTQAALVKDLGTRFEQDVIAVARKLLPWADAEFTAMHRQAQLVAPSFTLRGGTTEIMRSIVARDLVPR